MKSRNANWAVVLVVLFSIIGIVALAAVSNGKEETLLPLLITFVAPTIAALLAAERAGANNETLSKIDGRLNGELDHRISEAVTAALRSYHAAQKDDCASGYCN